MEQRLVNKYGIERSHINQHLWQSYLQQPVINFNGTLIFNSVNHNIGNHYNSSNGTFTAPVNGRYLFNWYTNVDTNGGNAHHYGEIG